jgi:hypothetical protein
VGELVERFVVEDLARLLGIGDDVADRHLEQLRARDADSAVAFDDRGSRPRLARRWDQAHGRGCRVRR